MRRLLGIAVIGFALGCGDDGGAGSPAERLSGSWVTMDSTTECWYGFAFVEDGYIEVKEVCELTDGSLGIVLDGGRFEATDDTFTWRVEESSCDYASTRPVTIRYTIDGDELTLVVPEGVLILKKAKDGDSGEGGVFEFGCFDEDGFFEPMSVGPVR